VGGFRTRRTESTAWRDKVVPTVMRPQTLRSYATEAGFTEFEVLPIEHDAFRLYLLRP
jgi:hypothetical protein